MCIILCISVNTHAIYKILSRHASVLIHDHAKSFTLLVIGHLCSPPTAKIRFQVVDINITVVIEDLFWACQRIYYSYVQSMCFTLRFLPSSQSDILFYPLLSPPFLGDTIWHIHASLHCFCLRPYNYALYHPIITRAAVVCCQSWGRSSFLLSCSL